MHLTSAVLLGAVAAMPLPRGKRGFVAMNFDLVTIQDTESRTSYVVETLTEGKYEYFANYTVGNPPQAIQAVIDTGSSDLWLYNVSSGQTPAYDATKSTTYVDLHQSFYAGYAGGYAAEGWWAEDTVDFGGAVIENMQFGTASGYVSYSEGGIIGIGPVGLEATSNQYPNLPARLKSQGAINHNAFSLYLNEPSATAGTLLFGGVDTAKYQGQLYQIPFLNSNDFIVNVSVAGIADQAVLDSGTSYIRLSPQIVSVLNQQYGAVYDRNQRLYYIPAGKPVPDLAFNFGKATVTVPGQALLNPFNGRNYFAVMSNSGSNNKSYLGQTFLRYAYVVYDVDNSSAAIAQAAYTSSSNIVPIEDAIPGAIPAY